MTESFQDILPFPETPDTEGLFDAQLSLPIPAVSWTVPIQEIVKRDGQHESFDKAKIAASIGKAAASAGAESADIAESIAAAVQIYLGKCLNGKPATVDQVSDAVERVLIQMAYAEVALAYARYRDRRARIRRLRRGDMRVLLGELEEAQHEREAARASDLSWSVKTSRDSIESWDRNRIVDALCKEAGMESSLALLIALEVEKQIQDAGITSLTASLVRELVGAKLIEHGLFEENEQRRRLGVPVYDATRIICGASPETIGGDPSHTDKMLARAVKKEYALTQVFSDQVTLAHLTGDLHLNELAQIDRLHSAEHSLAGLVMHDSPLLGIPGLGGVPDSPDMLLAQLVKFNDILDALFSRCAGWYAFNFTASPFVEKLNDNEMRRFAAMLLHECAYRHTASAEVSAPMRISLNWKAPENMAALDAAGGAPGRTYKQYEVTARRFAWALLQAFYEGGINDADFPSPRVEVVLDDAVLNTFEGTDYLRHAAKVALRRPNVYFLFLEKNCCEPALLWQPRNVVWHRVALNLPRAAIKTGANDAFYAELNRLCLLASDAHQQKRDFIETLLDPVGNAPLAPLALEQDGKPYIIAEDGLFALDLEGLGECAMVMCGTGAGHTGERIDFMEQTVEHMKHEIGKISRKTGMHCILSANTSPEIGNRFATLDTANYPQLLQKIAKIDTDTQAITYTQGISLDDGLRVSPYDKARMEGVFQQHLGEANYSVLKLGLTHASVNSLCDLLTMIARQTTCDGVYLML